jgi:predicted transcriptional regulator
MKHKISVQLSEKIFERLEAAAEQAGATRTAIVEAALNDFLSAGIETTEQATVRRLNWMSRQLEQLERDLRIVNETCALHARYHLTVAPAMPPSEQGAACLLGEERFEVFAAQVGRRVHLGTPLMQEAIDQLSATNPDLFASEIAEGAPLGAPKREFNQRTSATSSSNTEPLPRAAAWEGGSNGGFPAHRKSRSG